jgi:hypothetical protein
MRKEYDFLKSKKNPYVKLLKQQVTLRLETDTLDYFKRLAAVAGVSYRELIHLYLRDCVCSHRKPHFRWT